MADEDFSTRVDPRRSDIRCIRLWLLRCWDRSFVADWRVAAVVQVVLYVASGGGGSQARPMVLADWLVASRGWRLHVSHRIRRRCFHVRFDGQITVLVFVPAWHYLFHCRIVCFG